MQTRHEVDILLLQLERNPISFNVFISEIMHDFRITPYINNIMHTAIVQRKQKSEQY